MPQPIYQKAGCYPHTSSRWLSVSCTASYSSVKSICTRQDKGPTNLKWRFSKWRFAGRIGLSTIAEKFEVGLKQSFPYPCLHWSVKTGLFSRMHGKELSLQDEEISYKWRVKNQLRRGLMFYRKGGKQRLQFISEHQGKQVYVFIWHNWSSHGKNWTFAWNVYIRLTRSTMSRSVTLKNFKQLRDLKASH